MGWQFRLIDGQGTTNGQTAAINQAIALKPDGIVLGTIDAASQKTAISAAAAQGIKIIGWHSAGSPGPAPDLNLLTNIESDPVDGIMNYAKIEYLEPPPTPFSFPQLDTKKK